MDYENALANARGLARNSKLSPFDPHDYDVTPSKAVWVARNDGKNAWLEPVMWGLVPRWAKEADKGPRPINASYRLDGVAHDGMPPTSAYKAHRVCCVHF